MRGLGEFRKRQIATPLTRRPAKKTEVKKG